MRNLTAIDSLLFAPSSVGENIFDWCKSLVVWQSDKRALLFYL